MSKAAPAEMMRYTPMRDWLKENGISEYEVLKLIDAGRIRQGKLRDPKKKKGQVRAWYSASQIERDVLNRNGNEK
jgi:hypothetical protein